MPRKIFVSASKHFLLLGIGFFVALPFLWMITTSLKPPKMAFTSPYLLPTHFHWQNYLNAWTDAPFARYYFNSIFVAIFITIGQVITSILAAYAFDRFDFKFKKTDIELDKSQDSLNLQALWQDIYDAQHAAVEDYRRDYNIMPLKYWEAFNFIKYGPGQHFKEHHDHGYSYNCTLSLVAYVNDDYDGGELFFRLQGLNIKPKAGDLYIFPSNFMYPHQAMPVTSGTKYSIVTMLDYSKKFHTPEMYSAEAD